VPGALEAVRRAEVEATGAEAPGSWGEAVDVCPVEEGGLQLRFGEQAGRCAIELREQAYFTDRGWWGTRSLATELQCGNHVLTQGGMSYLPA